MKQVEVILIDRSQTKVVKPKLEGSHLKRFYVLASGVTA
jgi:hypothetical protein